MSDALRGVRGEPLGSHFRQPRIAHGFLSQAPADD